MTLSKSILLHVAALMGLLSALAAGACGRAESGQQQTPAAAPAPPSIEVVRVTQRPLDVQLSLPGELVAFQSVAIFPRVAGFVKTVAVDRGTVVRAGQVLATLEAPELVAQRSEAQSKLQAAEAQLASARAKADADKTTFERLNAAAKTPGVVAGNDLVLAEKTSEASQNQAISAQRGVEAARQALNVFRDMEAYLRITAPFNGVVTERTVHPGALVGPSNAGGAGAPMLRLVDQKRLRLVIPVPEAYTSELKTGTRIPFSVAAYPGQTFSGTVARVAHSVDVATRTMAIELDVENGDNRLAPGTFCQVKWPVRRPQPSVFVPSTSVASTTNRTFVIRVRNGKTEWVDVRTGLTAGTQVEVFGDLQPGDQVAGRGTDEIRPGTDVQPREAKPAV